MFSILFYNLKSNGLWFLTTNESLLVYFSYIDDVTNHINIVVCYVSTERYTAFGSIEL